MEMTVNWLLEQKWKIIMVRSVASLNHTLAALILAVHLLPRSILLECAHKWLRDASINLICSWSLANVHGAHEHSHFHCDALIKLASISKKLDHEFEKIVIHSFNTIIFALF